MSPRRVAENGGEVRDGLEPDVAAAVAAVLGDVAAGFAWEVAVADELVARAGDGLTAAYSVSRIATLFNSRRDRILRPLLAVYESGARWLATGMGGSLPPGWEDLPDRATDAPENLPEPVRAYLAGERRELAEIGERLGEAARTTLAEGIDAGETVVELTERLLAAFDADGAQLGDTRAARIARTEAGRAWNRSALDAARALPARDRPTVKQWLTRRDNRVRDAHGDVDGQLQLLGDPFTVGGVQMTGPGDPTAPAHLVINCRCEVAFARARQDLENPDADAQSAPTTEVALVQDFSDPSHTGPERVTAAADGSHMNGAMIALMPTAEDAERLAIEGGETPDQLHLTLFYLGPDGAAYTDDDRAGIVNVLAESLPDFLSGPITAVAFGANHWNATSDEPSWVWSVGDDRDAAPDAPKLSHALQAASYAVHNADLPEDRVPVQHSPWAAHICAAYADDPAMLAALEERLGEVTFDRIRVTFAGDATDIPLDPTIKAADLAADTAGQIVPRAWSTPDGTAIAYENQETGDGRVFAPGSLYWENGPWPLQYADEMLSGHEGAELAGAIEEMGRDGDRITASGLLYVDRWAGADAVMLLEQQAPLGISVDLDDVDIEFIDRRAPEDLAADEDGIVLFAASFPSASVLRMDDGGWTVTATPAANWTGFTAAGAASMIRTARTVQWVTADDGRIHTAGLRAALTAAGAALTAAAGDTDDPDRGELVHAESAGDVVMRITRGRVRGATLVSMPAYSEARIVLDQTEPEDDQAVASVAVRAAGADVTKQVAAYVTASPTPVGASHIAQVFGLTLAQARGYLAQALATGQIVKLGPGAYVGVGTSLDGNGIVAAMVGDLRLPIADRDTSWDGDAAASRVLTWATGDNDTADPERLSTAFLWRDDTADPGTLAAYKLGIADVMDDGLRIVPNAVYAVAGALEGARGGVDLPDEARDDLRDRVEELYDRLAEEFDDPALRAPWDEEDDMGELEASAWTAMKAAPPMPAAWFKEPTLEELPPGSGGVHHKDGRVYGWIAQTGEPHAGFPGRNLTIESLGKIDTTHFLRARFTLDDGSTVRAGAFTMNVPHDRDGAECNDESCQFDNSRTVAGVVTVGSNERGLWFSGAAAPWLSEWDRTVFTACQPSYHMKQARSGQWQLRAVLSVPVPGHSSPLVASVTHRSNLALTASAAMHASAVAHVPVTEPVFVPRQAASADDLPGLAAALVSGTSLVDDLLDAMERREMRREQQRIDNQAEAARLAAELAPVRAELAASAAGHKGDI